MAALEISTVGAKVKCVVESTAGSRPTSGYNELANVNSAPAIGSNPSTIDASNIKDGVTRYIPGRVDPGGIQSLTFNVTADGACISTWNAMADYVSAAANRGKRYWLEYCFPLLSDTTGENAKKGYFFPIIPLHIKSDNGISQNSLKTIEAPFIVDGEGFWDTAK